MSTQLSNLVYDLEHNALLAKQFMYFESAFPWMSDVCGRSLPALKKEFVKKLTDSFFMSTIFPKENRVYFYAGCHCGHDQIHPKKLHIWDSYPGSLPTRRTHVSFSLIIIE